jgi:hypothetical protein
MRHSSYAAAVLVLACGSVQAGTFIPLQTPMGQAIKFSQNGDYLSIFVNQVGGGRGGRAPPVRRNSFPA